MQPAKQFDLCPWDKLIAMPHMGWQHAGWFASYLVNATNILEWGCGGSTLWMAMMNLKAQILSIEHDRQWVARAQTVMDALVMGCPLDFNRLLRIRSSSKPQGDPYVKHVDIERFAPYDLIFIDGHERPACLAASYDLLAPGGVVFLHDSQRAEYAYAKEKLLDPPSMTLIDERTDESWVNPRAGMWAAQKS